MGYFRQNRSLIAWLACLAILLNALMPAIAHALAAEHDGPMLLTAICSASGTQFVPAPFDLPADKQPDTTSASAHCPYCLTHAGSAMLLPQTWAMHPVVTTTRTLPRLFYLAPYPLFAWAPAHPRAPPVLA